MALLSSAQGGSISTMFIARSQSAGQCKCQAYLLSKTFWVTLSARPFITIGTAREAGKQEGEGEGTCISPPNATDCAHDLSNTNQCQRPPWLAMCHSTMRQVTSETRQAFVWYFLAQ